MEIRNLSTFLEVAERRSFSRAADALGYTQSTVSAQIKQLETELGEPLFERIGHRIDLTERGKRLIVAAREIVNLAEGLTESGGESGESISGDIRLAMAPSLCDLMLGPIYAEYHRRHPGVRMQILCAETDAMIDQLRRGEADLAMVIDRPIFREELIIASETEVPMRFVAGRGSAWAVGQPISPEALLGMPLLLTESGLSYRAMLEEMLAERKMTTHPFIEMGSTERLLELVKLGLGVSFLPEYVTRDAEARGEIVYLDVPELKLRVRRQLLYHRQKWISPAMRSVLDYYTAASERL